jgi:flagellar motor switch protein FliM
MAQDHTLSQSEIDALLSVVNQGKLDLEGEGAAPRDRAEVVKYDLLSQDRIIRGRMPTLDIINDRFARQFRITLSNALRKMLQVSVESTSLMKYGEFLNYLPIPSCLNIVRLHPLRGLCVAVVEAKLIFAFLNNFFGGVTSAQEKIESRDFTAVELMIVRKVIDLFLEDLSRAWEPVYRIQGEYLRTEINPQFLAVAAPSDVVLLTSFDLEMESVRGTVQLVIPYGTIEPIRQHLSTSMQNEDGGSGESWGEQLGAHLQGAPVEAKVPLGSTTMTVRDLLELRVGDILTLDQDASAPLRLRVGGRDKFQVTPVARAGHVGVRVEQSVPVPEEILKRLRAGALPIGSGGGRGTSIA